MINILKINNLEFIHNINHYDKILNKAYFKNLKNLKRLNYLNAAFKIKKLYLLL